VGGVLVHCTMGVSRSAAIVAAYVMWATGWDVAQAVDKRIQEIKAQLPKDVTLTTTYDRSHLVD
jgi:protein-tyrosine phosphatase